MLLILQWLTDVQVFEKHLGLQAFNLPLLAAELVQEPTSKSRFAEDEASPVSMLHIRLLDMVNY